MAAAAPHHNHGLTIAATPNPIVSGDAVLIYGQLNTTSLAVRRSCCITASTRHRSSPSSARPRPARRGSTNSLGPRTWFTINTSAPIIPVTTSATISGVLTIPGHTAPDPDVMVTLWGHAYGAPYAPITSATTTTATDGSYKLLVAPQHNIEYQVRTSFAPFRLSAQLFEGVKYAVTLNPVASTSTVGSSVSFTGSVTPVKAGHVIELERLGADGHYHVVAVGFVNASSAYQFNWTFGTSGTKTFRVHIPGGPDNVGADSSPVTIAVTLPPDTSLPPGS